MSHYRALFQKSLPENQVQCGLCPRSCVIKDGGRGFCFGRRNIGGELVVESFGGVSGFAVDPIEKKPLYHFFPGTMILSFGTIGCNLNCCFCQNWNISRCNTIEGLRVEAQPAAIAEKTRGLGIPAVAFTYNEPIVFAEFAIETAAACHRVGLKTVAVTNGYISDEARPDFFRHMDAANVDLKAFSEAFYQRMCQGHLDPVLRTLRYLKHETNVWLEITTLLIPGENDDINEIRRMAVWILGELGPDVPLHLTAFHPDYHLQNRPSTSPAVLLAAREAALEEGLRYVYTGNIQDAVGVSTICPSCGRSVIERDGFSIAKIKLVDGRCANCGEKIAGRF